MGPHILVVDGDGEGKALCARLVDDGYRVVHAQNAREAYDSARLQPPELVVLDLVLPDADGLTLYVDLKMMTGAAVIVCSATKRRRDRPLGFKLGVDDFVAKPFDWEDLQGRIESALRRAPAQLPGATGDGSASGGRGSESQAPSRRLGEAGPWARAVASMAPTRAAARKPASTILRADETKQVGDRVARRSPATDSAPRRTMVAGRSLSLTPTEHRLLSMLLGRPDELVPREELAKAVWGYEDPWVAESINVHISRLRGKLSQADWRDGPAPSIRSVRGQGYAFSRDQAAS